MEHVKLLLKKSVLTNETCQECKGNRFIVYLVEGVEPTFWIAKCIDCGIIGTHCTDKEFKKTLCIIVDVLESTNCLKNTVDTEDLEYFFEHVERTN